jgi:hypothetical protein
MSVTSEAPWGVDEQSDNLRYLSRRIQQEAKAAIRATSVEATTIHVILATAYAKRHGECSARGSISTSPGWVDEHRVW